MPLSSKDGGPDMDGGLLGGVKGVFPKWRKWIQNAFWPVGSLSQE